MRRTDNDRRDVPDSGRRGPSPRRVAVAGLSVVVFAGVVILAITGWFAWVGLAMLLAFIEGVTDDQRETE